METSGRERRHRYYTVANYYKLVSEEALDKSSACFTDIDLVNIGGFYAIRPDSFYENDEELVHRQDAAKDAEPVRGSELKVKKPLVSNFHPKRGRPRKPISQEHGNSSAKRKRKASPLSDDGLETSGSEESSTKRRRLNGTSIIASGMLFLFVIY
jgi:oxalate---CoA ligase